MPVIERIEPGHWRAAPWGANQGVAYQIAQWAAADAPVARVSIADIAIDGPFTAMPDRRRWSLVLDDGGGLGLTIDGAAQRLVTGDSVGFAGAAAVSARLTRSARVLNLIVHVDVAFAARRLVEPAAIAARPGTLVVFAIAPCVVTVGATEHALAANDTLVIASSQPIELSIAGAPGVDAAVLELAVAPTVGGGAVAVVPSAPTEVVVDGRLLTSFEAMHAELARAFGFPDFYGANLDALVDCLSSLAEPADGMSTVHARPGSVVVLVVEHAQAAAAAVFAALCDVIAFVNFRLRERGDDAVLTIAAAR